MSEEFYSAGSILDSVEDENSSNSLPYFSAHFEPNEIPEMNILPQGNTMSNTPVSYQNPPEMQLVGVQYSISQVSSMTISPGMESTSQQLLINPGVQSLVAEASSMPIYDLLTDFDYNTEILPATNILQPTVVTSPLKEPKSVVNEQNVTDDSGLIQMKTLEVSDLLTEFNCDTPILPVTDILQPSVVTSPLKEPKSVVNEQDVTDVLALIQMNTSDVSDLLTEFNCDTPILPTTDILQPSVVISTSDVAEEKESVTNEQDDKQSASAQMSFLEVSQFLGELENLTITKNNDAEVTVDNTVEKESLDELENLTTTKNVDAEVTVDNTAEKESLDELENLTTTKNVDAEVTVDNTAEKELVKTEERKSPSLERQIVKIPKRRDPSKAGSAGRSISVFTNTLNIRFGENFPSEVVHYDLKFVPEKPKYLLKRAFLVAKHQLFPDRNPAFDGAKNLYSVGDLPFGQSKSIEVKFDNEDRGEVKYKVTFKKVNSISMKWLRYIRAGIPESERDQKALQALNIILNTVSATSAIQVGRSFFTPPTGTVTSLGGGMDVWTGLFQSAIVGWKPFLNVDVAHKGFPKPQSVLDLIKSFCTEQQQPRGGRNQYNQRGGRNNYGGRNNRYQPQQFMPPMDQQREVTRDDINANWDQINGYLRGLSVTFTCNGQRRTRQPIQGLVNKLPHEDFFQLTGSDQVISVLQYFQQAKNYKIQRPDLPCLWIGKKQKNTHVPLELCTIEAGQVVMKKLNEKQTANLVKTAATGTDERKRKIMEAFKSAFGKTEAQTSLKEFDVSVNGEFEEVPARVLQPPKLIYGQNGAQGVNVQQGVWRNERFLQPSQLLIENSSWTILDLNRNSRADKLYSFAKMFRAEAENMGLIIGEPRTPFGTITKNRGTVTTIDIEKYLIEQKNRPNGNPLQLVIVVFPDSMKSFYSMVKQVAELKVGVLTQCIKSSTMDRKMNKSTVVNILQKVNAKLAGVNHALDPVTSRPKCLEEPCMIVGADVTHPSPESKTMPSIAAVAASHDPNAQFQYNVEIRLQPPRMEIIKHLLEIMKIQLRYFYGRSGYKPQRIIFYRDGVSEGQFEEVMVKELQAIRQACREVEEGYEPRITFLVVQKRHHIRFFPKNPTETDDKNKNVKAGTIVDTVITHPTDIDFYLVSHASIQGTARPTKYRCLWDDSDMTEDEIEQLTYYLCHMFARCTRTVSYPVPTYYAHLAAFRARSLIQGVNIDLKNLDQEQITKLKINEELSKQTPMFFV